MIVVGNGPWQPVVLSGAIALIFGAIVLIWPASAVQAFVVLFGIFVLIDGAAGVVAAFHARVTATPWAGTLVIGLLGIVVGLIALAWPGGTLQLVIYVAALWAIVKGVYGLVVAQQQRQRFGADRTASYGGFAWLVFGALLFLWPMIGVVAIAWLIGAVAALFGVVLIALGLRLKQHMGGAV